MYITAHSGACGTKANHVEFLEKIQKYPVNAIEVDIRFFRNKLFLSHNPTLILKNKVSLDCLFSYIRDKNFYINCDLKQFNILKLVLLKAKEYGVSEKLYFTGNVSKEDIKALDSGRCYLGGKYLKSIGCDLKTLNDERKVQEILGKIKEEIDRIKNSRILGINIPYKVCSDKLVEIAKKIDLKISVYTVDRLDIFKNLVNNPIVNNITTNLKIEVLEYLNWV